MSKSAKSIKQLTFNSLPTTTAKQQNPKTKSTTIQKRIHITQMTTTTKIDELSLKISFKLEPSYKVFSKIKANLLFENTLINTLLIQIPQGPLGTNNLEYNWTLYTRDIAEGTCQLKRLNCVKFGLQTKSYAKQHRK
jgi:hypothetical protein